MDDDQAERLYGLLVTYFRTYGDDAPDPRSMSVYDLAGDLFESLPTGRQMGLPSLPLRTHRPAVRTAA